MKQWQDAASRQVSLLTDRVNELLSRGLELLRSELGVDLGLKPELIPPWMILLLAGTGLLLMVALWASVCRGLFKKRPVMSHADDGIELKRTVGKPVKSEEPKKKKKKAEKARKMKSVLFPAFPYTASRASCQANATVTTKSHVMAKTSFRLVFCPAMPLMVGVLCISNNGITCNDTHEF